jgi:class 3 adenylate cyclase
MVAEPRLHVMVVVDIERFGERSDPIQQLLRDRLYGVMETALETVGVNRQEVRDPEDRGDGLLWVLPSWVSMVALTGRFTARLHAELLKFPAGGEERMRLRAALHVGKVKADRGTWVGTEVNTAFRLVNADPLRKALADTTAPYVLMMSRQWHDRIAEQEIEGFDRAACRRVSVHVKELHDSAWIYVPRSLPEIPPSRPIGKRLRRLAAGVTELEDALSMARKRHEHVARRITRVPDIPERPDDLRSSLDLIRERGQSSEQRWAVPDVVRCEQTVKRFLERIEDFERRLDKLLEERDELRGLLKAYKDKEASSALSENPRLAVLFRTAYELLQRGPCDLRDAREAVERYQRALWHALGYGGSEGAGP